jgi:hypothetical protein
MGLKPPHFLPSINYSSKTQNDSFFIQSQVSSCMKQKKGPKLKIRRLLSPIPDKSISLKQLEIIKKLRKRR